MSTGIPMLDVIIFIGTTLYVVWLLVAPGDKYPVSESDIQEHRNISTGFGDLLEHGRKQEDAALNGAIGPGLRRVFVHAPPEHIAEMRVFYLNTLKMAEMGAPDGSTGAESFYANKGLTHFSFGTGPDFDETADVIIKEPRLDHIAEALAAAGYDTERDYGLRYVRQLSVTDPAGNRITLSGA
jgi:hypothetical protein